MLKNTASQKAAVFAIDVTTGLPVTGDQANITAYISKDGGGANVSNDANPTQLDATNLPGIYVFDLTQAETNCDLFTLVAKSATSDVQLEPVICYTQPPVATIQSGLALEATLTAIKGAGWTTETLAAIKGFVDDLETRLTAARAGYLDKLNVTGTLANTDNAASFKADVSSLALEATLTAMKGVGWSTETLVALATSILTRAAPGDEMDLVDAPNGTAVTAIQSGLAIPGDEMDLVDAPNALAVAAIQSGLATAGGLPGLGADGNVLISTDAQDLSATLDVNTKTIEAADAGDAIETAVQNKLEANDLNQFPDLIEDNGGTYRFTVDALAEAPTAAGLTTGEKAQLRDALGIDGAKTTAAGGQLQLVKARTDALTDVAIQADANAALVANNLDHLAKVPVASNADMTAEVVDGTILSNVLTAGADTSDFDPATDSLEAIRDNQAGVDVAAIWAYATRTLTAGLENLDAAVSTRAVPGDEMDLVDAPNADAVTAIQNGLALTTDLTNLDAAVSSRAAPGDEMDLVDAPNATAIAAIVSGLALEATLTAIKGAGWTNETLTALVGFVDTLETRLTAARAGYLDKLNITGNVASQASLDALAVIASDVRLSRLDVNVSTRAAPGAQMDLVNSPNATAVTAIKAGLALEATLTAMKGAGWTTETLVALGAFVDSLETRLTSARAGYLDKLNVTGTLANTDNANSFKANVSALALEATVQALAGVCTDQRLARLDVAVSTRAAPGAQMDLVNAPNATAVTAIKSGLALASVCTDQRLARLDAAVTSRAAPGAQMDLVNAPNATAVTAIKSGLALEATLTNIKGAGWTNQTLVALATYVDTLEASFTTLLGRITSARAGYLDKLNVTGVLANTDNASLFKADISQLALQSTLTALAAVATDQRLARLDAAVSTRAAPGAAMDLIAAPNAAAITAIQSGLALEATLQALLGGGWTDESLQAIAAMVDTLETSMTTLLTRLSALRAGYLDKLNVTGVLANTDNAATFKANVSALALQATLTALAGVCTDQRLAHLDADVSSRAEAGDQMDLVNSPNSNAVAFIKTGLALESTLTALKGAGWTDQTLVAIKGFVDDLESRLTSARAGYLDKLNVAGDLANTANAASFKAAVGALALEATLQSLVTVCSNTRLARLDAAVSTRAVAGDEMDLVDAPNATAIAALQADLALQNSLQAALDLLQADSSIDTTTTPWQIVLTHKTTHAELLRKDLKQPDGSAVTSSLHIVGQEEEAP